MLGYSFLFFNSFNLKVNTLNLKVNLYKNTLNVKVI